MGRLMAAKLIGRFGSVRNEKDAQKYVNLIGHTVARQSGRAEITFHFGILKSDEVNAFATPGGYIFVTTALLKAVKSEPELGGILAHEVAHVSEKHMYRMIRPKKKVTAEESIARFFSRGSDLGVAISQTVNAGIKLLLETGLGQEKEHEADQVGAFIASSAGYAPSEYLDFIKRLGKNQTTVSKTHPPFPERIANLNNFLKKNGLDSLNYPAKKEVMRTRFEQALKTIR